MTTPGGDPSWVPWVGGVGFASAAAGLLATFVRTMRRATGRPVPEGRGTRRTPEVFVSRAPLLLIIGVALIVVCAVGA
ncbi:MAG TPA: hypothetical protein VFE86_03575, partial [Ilumatobacteraceae bacterium]|nr:hypothetical protein [Ilumatobacteraceae bacterium]